MPRLRLSGTDRGQPADIIPFPRPTTRAAASEPEDPDPKPDPIAALNEVSRRMSDLARALGLPGYFGDEDDDRPTAA